ncbi:MAG: hypothetical protein SXU28_15365, partial [Pseudomonadota bacterium]|nr:hypothetical protein [Pseudomonadota bacterium]
MPIIVFDTGPEVQHVGLVKVKSVRVSPGAATAFDTLETTMSYLPLPRSMLNKARRTSRGDVESAREVRRLARLPGGVELLAERDALAAEPGTSSRTVDVSTHERHAARLQRHLQLLQSGGSSQLREPAESSAPAPVPAVAVARAARTRRQAEQRAQADFINLVMELAVQSGLPYAPIILMGMGGGKSGWGKMQRVWSPGRMADILSKQFCVLATDEFNTSQFCPCGSPLVSKLTNDRPSWRTKRCSSCQLGIGVPGAVKGWAMRDWLSCAAILW